MRITRLDLLRFGKFTDTTLALPHAAHDFHLIVGPNEAGKSTLRTAIQELLFGIDTRSPYNFVHAHKEMRLGALIEHGGKQLDFVRTKGNSKTLQSSGATVLPDNALLPYLGAIERKFFEQMFGLDHDRLVKGGQEILSASNNVGQILFQAAAGIGSLGTIRDRLESEAESLWAPRKAGNREYYLAADELAQAEATLKLCTVKTKDWQEARSSVDAVTEQLQAARRHYEQLAKERLQLERVRRVAPMLSSLNKAEQQLADLGPVVPLPENASAQLTLAEQEIAIAQRSHELFANQAADLSEKIATFAPSSAVLARAADIEALSAQRQTLRNVEGDIAKRESEILVLWQDVQNLTHQLDWPQQSEEALSQRLPGSLLRASMDDLARGHAALQQAQTLAQKTLHDRHAEIQAIASEITLLPATHTPVALSTALAAARAMGDVAAQVKKAATQVARLERELQAAEPALGGWNPGVHTLRTLLPPTHEQLQSLSQERAALALAAATSRDRATDVQSEIPALQLEIAQYKTAHQPVTLEEVQHSRAERDAQWAALKAGALAMSAAASGLEWATQRADNLADQRHDKAHEASELQSRLDRLQRLQLQLTDHSQRATLAAEALAGFDARWSARASAIGLADMALLQVNDWRLARERVLAAASALAEARAAQHDLAATAQSSQTALEQALQGLAEVAPGQPLATLIVLADEWVSTATRTQERRSTLASQQQRAAAALADLQNQVALAQAALADWQLKWTAHLAQAHLPPQSAPAAVTAALALFERIYQQLQKIRDIRVNRIEAMQQELQRFALVASALAKDLAPEWVAEPANQISFSLDNLLKHHVFAAQELQRLTKEHALALAQARTAQTKRVQAEAVLAPLLHASGADNNEALRTAAANSDRQRSLHAEKELALRQLISASDGLDRETLAGEWAATDVDASAANLDAIKRQTDAVVEQLNTLSGALSSAQAVLEKIAGQGDAARAESQRQEALARMANALERYLKVYTAGRLLRWSIERFRETKQGPMLARASDVFMGLTDGAFSKLVVDYEVEPLKLTGQRASGALVEISGMSEGTRDQLYLALRLAALELHLEQTTPLPLIADDLFINYDDTRARAGLQALAKLSKATQVIFLSHHAHLVPVAQSVFGAQLNVVHLG